MLTKTYINDLIAKTKNPVFDKMTYDQSRQLVEPGSRFYDGHYAPLKAFIESSGWEVIDAAEEPWFATDYLVSRSTSGMTDHDHKQIWIRASLTPNEKFVTLLHEAAHRFENQDAYVPQWLIPLKVVPKIRAAVADAIEPAMETAVETAGYLVLRELGFDTDYSAGYIRHNLGERAEEQILDVAQEAARIAGVLYGGLSGAARMAA